ncbi:MAG: GWxTD domain-containing protein [Gemmatimonadota bacterium]|nr:GWxTD domain-containing protein [Gemmatimonadota bacterium]
MKSYRRSIQLLIAAFVASLVPAVAVAQTGAGLALETNRYYTGQGRALVEGAVEIPYTLLTFEPAGEVLKSRAVVEVTVDREDGEQVYRTEHEITPEAINEQMAASDRVSSIETFAIYAPPGEYTARARITDDASGRTYEVSRSLDVPERQPLFSDVLLSNHVQKDVRLQEGAYLPYLIGTTMFNPNPKNVFHQDSPLLYFYYEVNPEAIEAASSAPESLTLGMEIVGNGGTTVKDLGERTIKITDERNFDLGAFNIAGLVPGRYRLMLRCETGCPPELETAVEFEVRAAATPVAFLERERPAAAENPGVKYYAGFSEAQVDSVVGILDLMFTANQKQLLETLSTEGKIRFLNRFWDSVDPDPATPANEFKNAFEQRVAYADQFFGTLQRDGHDTDRGEIYLIYGEPTERIDRPVEATVGPYVIWNYSNQGETFAFGDFNKNGEYRLIYSTDENHPGDPTIQNLVDTDQATSSPSFLRTSRGYERVITDIRQNRVTTGYQQ